jgi:hypothetical protein
MILLSLLLEDTDLLIQSIPLGWKHCICNSIAILCWVTLKTAVPNNLVIYKWHLFLKKFSRWQKKADKAFTNSLVQYAVAASDIWLTWPENYGRKFVYHVLIFICESTVIMSNICWHMTGLYPQKLALTSPTSSGRSVGIVRSWTKATELVS